MSATRQPGGSQAPKHGVVCLTKYIPYPGIAHAGGEYLEAHAAALKPLADMSFLAPATPLNLEALERVGVDAHAELLDTRPLRGIWFRWLQVEATLAGTAIYKPVRRLFRGNRAPWSELASADVIEVQWAEMISLAPLIRRQLPGAKLVGVAHDINSQRWARQAAQSLGLRRILTGSIARKTRRQESQSFAALDVLIVFSEKDAELARELAPALRIEVVHPGFTPKATKRTPSMSEPIVLFVGAMNRLENEDAVLWFLNDVWPKVSEQVPHARFVIAGAQPSNRVATAASSAENTEITGFVASLEPVYESASLCVVPLRTGAGVKFKTIDAMLAGVAVVTTRVGAEGIAAESLFAGLTDNADEFAAAVVAALLEPEEARTEQARVWAEATYGTETFTTRLHEVYRGVLNA